MASSLDGVVWNAILTLFRRIDDGIRSQDVMERFQTLNQFLWEKGEVRSIFPTPINLSHSILSQAVERARITRELAHRAPDSPEKYKLTRMRKRRADATQCKRSEGTGSKRGRPAPKEPRVNPSHGEADYQLDHSVPEQSVPGPLSLPPFDPTSKDVLYQPGGEPSSDTSKAKSGGAAVVARAQRSLQDRIPVLALLDDADAVILQEEEEVEKVLLANRDLT